MHTCEPTNEIAIWTTQLLMGVGQVQDAANRIQFNEPSNRSLIQNMVPLAFGTKERSRGWLGNCPSGSIYRRHLSFPRMTSPNRQSPIEVTVSSM